DRYPLSEEQRMTAIRDRKTLGRASQHKAVAVEFNGKSPTGVERVDLDQRIERCCERLERRSQCVGERRENAIDFSKLFGSQLAAHSTQQRRRFVANVSVVIDRRENSFFVSG